MGITYTRMGLWMAGMTLVASTAAVSCIKDDGETAADSGGTGAGGNNEGGADTSSGGSGGSAGSSTSGTGGSTPTGDTKCSASIVIPASAPGIADFEGYDGAADLSEWSFALGGDSSTGVYAGPFGYGDYAADNDTLPETFDAVDGNDGSAYALRIADTDSDRFGGGMGLWLSDCVDASAFSGISFWVRGSAPTGQAKLSLLMEETTWAESDAVGTCEAATEEVCVQPTYEFDVSDTWTEVRIPWSEFTAGDNGKTSVVPDGHNIWQIQFDVGLEWLPDATGAYVPTPAAYEVVVDDLTFF